MKTKLRLMMTMLLLAVMGSVWGAEDNIATATFNGKNATYTEGWTTTGTGKGRTDCIIIGSGENITSPSFDLSGYSKVTISIKARRYGTLPDSKATIQASIDGISVGTTDAEGTNASTSLDVITFTPTPSMSSAVIVFTCTNATLAGSTHGAGINEIVITGSTDASATVNNPVFTPSAGTYNEPQTVTLTCDTEGATIYYTLDGSTPTTSSNVYSTAISVSETTTIKALAIKDGAESEVVSAEYIIKSDYVTLPYVWEGGTKSDLNAVSGITSDGLGSDYAAGNAPYRVKLDGTGDYILIKTNERPGYVTIEVKMIGGSVASTITVQGSSDGETFRDIQTLTISGDQNDICILKTTNFFAEDDRYVKLVFTKGSNVGVGPFSISEFAFDEPVDPDVSFENETITLKEGNTFTNTINKPSDLTVSYSVTEGAEYVSVDANTGEVTALAVGQATITASWDAVEFLYNEGSVSYVVNVVENTTGKYVKVSNESELYDGLEILILNEDYSKTLGEERNNNFGAADVNIDESGIATPSDEATLLTLKGEPGAWYFLTPDNKYLYAASNSSNHLKAETTPDDNAKATIVFEEGNATITFQRENGHNTVMFNNSTNPQVFSCYLSTATQKPVQIYANKTYEKVSFTTDGYKSYVTRNAIDWGKTLERNSDNVDVHAYQVTALSKTAVTLEELGDGVVTSAETPVIVKGKKGVNLLVIASEEGSNISGTNLLKKGSERSESEKDFMYVLQKSKQWSEAKPYEQYNFYPLNPARWNEIGDRQAYLVLATSPGSDGAGSGPSVDPKPIGMRFIHATGEDSLVSEDAGLVDGINDIQQNASLDGEYYSVSGVRVAAPTKGLYIVNGKKVLVK